MDSADEFQSSSLDPRTVRKTYLVTYSQTNRIWFPTHESFRQSVAGAFTKGSSKSKVLHWACCLESNQFFLSSNHPNMQEMSPLKTKSSVQAISKKRKSWFTDR